jgi:hypothetical protein
MTHAATVHGDFNAVPDLYTASDTSSGMKKTLAIGLLIPEVTGSRRLGTRH